MKLKQKDQNLPFWLYFAFMAVYYGYRLFGIGPWYDELYTYASFISRGPIYAAIHWPLPNNHVFYSVLSGVLDCFGNSYIGLRGVSYLASLGTLYVLYTLCGRYFSKALSLGAVCLFSSMEMVNSLSVQGRGYALTVFLYVLALYQLSHICLDEKPGKSRYILFSLCLTGALYAIASCTFWVIPLCLAGGFYLLLTGQFRRMWSLVASALVAAVNTLCLYTVIWLAIGSNLLVKDVNSGYYGLGHVQLILKAPFAAVKTGIDYMLATPYIQSVGYPAVFTGFYGWITGVLEQMLTGGGLFFSVLCAGALVLLAVCVPVSLKRQQYGRLFFALYLLVSILMLPGMVFLQATLPYNRVFSFFGVVLAVLVVFLLAFLLPRDKNRVDWCFAAVFAVFALCHLLSGYYNRPLGEREDAIADALSHAGVTVTDQRIFLTDDYQQYVLKFYWDMDVESVQAKEATMILVPKTAEDAKKEVPQWPDLYTAQTLPAERLGEMTAVYENGWYTVYVLPQ